MPRKGAALAAGCGAVGAVTSGAQHNSPPAAPAACSLLKSADVLAVAATFPRDTITIDGHSQKNEPPTSECGYNQKGVFAPTSDGITTSLTGDQWAELTVIAGGAAYAYDLPSHSAIAGLGDGAYWDAGSNTVVVKVGQNILQVIDDVPANTGSLPALGPPTGRPHKPSPRKSSATCKTPALTFHFSGLAISELGAGAVRSEPLPC